MFEVPSFCTHTSSESSTPLLNSHINSRLFKTAPDFNQPLLQFVDGVNFRLVNTTQHHIPPPSIRVQPDLRAIGFVKRNALIYSVCYSSLKSCIFSIPGLDVVSFLFDCSFECFLSAVCTDANIAVMSCHFCQLVLEHNIGFMARSTNVTDVFFGLPGPKQFQHAVTVQVLIL